MSHVTDEDCDTEHVSASTRRMIRWVLIGGFIALMLAGLSVAYFVGGHGTTRTTSATTRVEFFTQPKGPDRFVTEMVVGTRPRSDELRVIAPLSEGSLPCEATATETARTVAVSMRCRKAPTPVAECGPLAACGQERPTDELKLDAPLRRRIVLDLAGDRVPVCRWPQEPLIVPGVTGCTS